MTGFGKRLLWGFPASITLFLCLAGSLFLAACSPERLLVSTSTSTPRPVRTNSRTPTRSPTQTLLPSLTASSTSTASSTPSATVTPTRIPSQTTTPLPGIGALRHSIQDFYLEVGFQFDTIGYTQGEYVVKAYSPTGFTIIDLYGEPDYLGRAKIAIITTGEAARLSTVYWMVFLEFTTPDGERAARWVREHYIAAATNGRVETMLGQVKIILEVTPRTLVITVLPVE